MESEIETNKTKQKSLTSIQIDLFGNPIAAQETTGNILYHKFISAFVDSPTNMFKYPTKKERWKYGNELWREIRNFPEKVDEYLLARTKKTDVSSSAPQINNRNYIKRKECETSDEVIQITAFKRFKLTNSSQQPDGLPVALNGVDPLRIFREFLLKDEHSLDVKQKVAEYLLINIDIVVKIEALLLELNERESEYEKLKTREKSNSKKVVIKNNIDDNNSTLKKSILEYYV